MAQTAGSPRRHVQHARVELVELRLPRVVLGADSVTSQYMSRPAELEIAFESARQVPGVHVLVEDARPGLDRRLTGDAVVAPLPSRSMSNGLNGWSAGMKKLTMYGVEPPSGPKKSGTGAARPCDLRLLKLARPGTSRCR